MEEEEAHLCQERKAEVSEDTPLSEDTGNDPNQLLLEDMAKHNVLVFIVLAL